MRLQAFSAFLIGCISILARPAAAQREYLRDSVVNIRLVGANYSLEFPAADMAKRWGDNSTIGGSFWIKNAHNWLFGLEYNYIFGSTLKEQHILDSITMTIDNTQYFISTAGQLQTIDITERGHLVFLKAGKILPIWGANKNSGLMLKGALGYMEHHIRYYWGNAENAPPQMAGDLSKGYDRLTSGIALSESVGWLHLDTKNIFNFSAELEAIQGFTQNRRSLNFDTMQKDNKQRLDLLFGLKVHWYFPLYGKSRGGYYYY